MPSRIRRAIFERDGHQCLKCETQENLTLDHIDPDGQLYALGNLQTLCWDCNRKKRGVIDYRPSPLAPMAPDTRPRWKLPRSKLRR